MPFRSSNRRPWVAFVVLVLFAACLGEKPGPDDPVERFYIIKLATSLSAPHWADYILDVRANGDGVAIREFQIAPLSRFCSDDVTVKVAEKFISNLTVSQLSGELRLCSPGLQQQVALGLRKSSYVRAVAVSDSARFGIVAKCEDDYQVTDLPFPQALDRKKLHRAAPNAEALFTLFDRVERQAFGRGPVFPSVELSSDERDIELQQAAAKYINELRSGEFDRGFGGRNCRGLNSGCDEHPMEALLRSYKGVVTSTIGAQVRLLDRDKLPLIRYVEPEYPLSASARVEDRVPLEVELNPAGKVVHVTVLGGDEALRPAAVNAAQRWEFKPGSGRFLQMTLDFSLKCP